MEGVLLEVRHQIIADFYGKKCFKMEDVYCSSFKGDGMQKKKTLFIMKRSYLMQESQSLRKKAA